MRIKSKRKQFYNIYNILTYILILLCDVGRYILYTNNMIQNVLFETYSQWLEKRHGPEKCERMNFITSSHYIIPYYSI